MQKKIWKDKPGIKKNCNNCIYLTDLGEDGFHCESRTDDLYGKKRAIFIARVQRPDYRERINRCYEEKK